MVATYNMANSSDTFEDAVDWEMKFKVKMMDEIASLNEQIRDAQRP